MIREVNDKDNIKEGGINYRQRFIVDTGEGGEKVVFQYMLDMNKCFKVIGEISPDALGYVKEGDEFGEDDIRIGAGSIMNARFHFVPFEGDDQKEWFPNNGWELYTQIKDPCGHFH